MGCPGYAEPGLIAGFLLGQLSAGVLLVVKQIYGEKSKEYSYARKKLAAMALMKTVSRVASVQPKLRPRLSPNLEREQQLPGRLDQSLLKLDPANFLKKLTAPRKWS
eukprot:m.33485 g.33485  ORF g.33485 m.33485 type:complete len:107 (+) comp31818_c0_seq1:269-589(+)